MDGKSRRGTPKGGLREWLVAFESVCQTILTLRWHAKSEASGKISCNAQLELISESTSADNLD